MAAGLPPAGQGDRTHVSGAWSACRRKTFAVTTTVILSTLDDAGRWRVALVVARDQRSALVAYVADRGPFGDRLDRVRFDRVRLPTDNVDG
jgi:hypothetical protein